MTLLAMLTIICLSRHFIVSVMEARGPDEIMLGLPYLLVTVLAVPPIVSAGLENINVGVSVIDRDLRCYLDLIRYPPGLMRVGVPIADLIRCNAEGGDCGPGEGDGAGGDGQ
jgi:hypothetical protein